MLPPYRNAIRSVGQSIQDNRCIFKQLSFEVGGPLLFTLRRRRLRSKLSLAVSWENTTAYQIFHKIIYLGRSAIVECFMKSFALGVDSCACNHTLGKCRFTDHNRKRLVRTLIVTQ